MIHTADQIPQKHHQLSFLSLTAGSSNAVVRVWKAATDHKGSQAEGATWRSPSCRERIHSCWIIAWLIDWLIARYASWDSVMAMEAQDSATCVFQPGVAAPVLGDICFNRSFTVLASSAKQCFFRLSADWWNTSPGSDAEAWCSIRGRAATSNTRAVSQSFPQSQTPTKWKTWLGKKIHRES